jgi:hypothetical protein
MRTRSLVSLLALCIAPAALAQGVGVDPGAKFAWAENVGYLNFRDAGSPAGSQGVRVNVGGGFMTGFVWGENVGWISLASGPVGPFLNTTGLNYGVNVAPATGNLSGYAWGENIGWINFSGGALATPPNPARYDAAARRLRGYAWGENVGWINLDDAAKFVGFICSADMNLDGETTFDDIQLFVTLYNANDPRADFNLDAEWTFDDIQSFVQAYNLCAAG